MWPSALGVLGAMALVWGLNDEKIVKGIWRVDSSVPCPEEDQYPYKLEMKMNKMNRTHDWFHATFSMLEDVTNISHGAHIEWRKKVDGGYKLQYQVSPASFCDFAKEISESNFRSLLTNIRLENPDCPIPKGDYELSEYPFNYAELPEEGLPGQYLATAYLLKQDEKVMCTMFYATFLELDDDDDD